MQVLQRKTLNTDLRIKSFRSTFSRVASDKSSVNAYQSIHKDLLEGIQQEKMSIEGVNMEEEMVNLMAFQKYFVANSKAITTMNEVFDSLFSIIR